MFERQLRHMTGDIPNGFVASFARFGQTRDGAVSVIVPASVHLAFDLTFLQPVFSETIGFAGSFGLGFPKGKTYQSLAGLS
jgi:hypothetical protein